jgi:hypothetical protein
VGRRRAFGVVLRHFAGLRPRRHGSLRRGHLPPPELAGRVHGPYTGGLFADLDLGDDPGAESDFDLDAAVSLAYQHRSTFTAAGADMGRAVMSAILGADTEFALDLSGWLGWSGQRMVTAEGLEIDVGLDGGAGLGVRLGTGDWTGRPRPFLRVAVEFGWLTSTRRESDPVTTPYAGATVGLGLEIPGGGRDRWAISVSGGRRSFGLGNDNEGEPQLRGYPWEFGLTLAWIRPPR